MIIIGNIPDIFDAMPYAYGVDNIVVFDKRIYNDLPTKTISTIDASAYAANMTFNTMYGFGREYYINNELYTGWKYNRKAPAPDVKYAFSNLFYCGKVYLIANKLICTDKDKRLYVATDEYFTVSNDMNADPFYIDANDAILHYAQENNLPFFEYSVDFKNSDLTIQPSIKYIPLMNIKSDIFKNVDVVYNDIYSYMLLYMSDKDIVEVSNNDKIQQAGFDLKSSFRKMK